MKTQHLFLGGFLVVMGMAACNGMNGTKSPSDSTTTTTTTTTTVRHQYTGNFVPKPDVKYVDLKTNQQITVRIDTIRGTIVNSETDQPVDLFVEPETHDTIYGVTGSVVNKLVVHNESGDLSVDTMKVNNVAPPPVTDQPVDDAHTGKVKYKENASGDKSKYKDEDVKVKEKNGVIKTKDR